MIGSKKVGIFEFLTEKNDKKNHIILLSFFFDLDHRLSHSISQSKIEIFLKSGAFSETTHLGDYDRTKKSLIIVDFHGLI